MRSASESLSSILLIQGEKSKSAGHEVLTSVWNVLGFDRCKSRTAAVSITRSPGESQLFKITLRMYRPASITH
jgi:hypothetical protein